MKRAILAALVALFVGAQARPGLCDPVSVVSQTAIADEGVTQFVLHSERLGRDFKLVVQAPRFEPFLPGQKIAAVYALDGGYGLTGSLTAFLSNRAVMAPAYMFSLSYVPGQPSFRATDFAHNPFTVGAEKGGGGGGAFEAFLLQDLRPFIEARYPVDPRSSVLFGHSMGAVFAANVFANRPESFAGYVIGSFVEPRDPGVVDRVAAAARGAGGQRVFLAVGGAEDETTEEKRGMRKGFADLAAAFRRGGSRVAVEARSYPRENHLSYYPNLTIDGLRFVLPPIMPVDLTYAPLTAEMTRRYAGAYVLPDGRRLKVGPAYGNYLKAEVAGGATIYLLPNGTDRYYGFPADLDVRFDGGGMTLAGRGAAPARAERAR